MSARSSTTPLGYARAILTGANYCGTIRVKMTRR
jgi:hypothetical protein